MKARTGCVSRVTLLCACRAAAHAGNVVAADCAELFPGSHAVTGDLAHHRRLIGIQAGAGMEGGADVLAGDHRGVLVGAPFDLVDQATLQVEELRGRVAGLIKPPVHGDQHRSLGAEEFVGQLLEGGQGLLR